MVKRFSPAVALRERFRRPYGWRDLRADLFSGIIVGVVAIPLGMALAIATGVAPQYGLYTVIIAGALVALLGGSRFQVTGPTAAFVVILAPIVAKFGFYGLLMAGFMSGIILVLMGLFGMGQLIQYIPHPVTTGFTSGIAVVIASIQIKDFFGLTLDHNPDGIINRLVALFSARGTWDPAGALIALLTVLVLIFWPKFHKKIPAPLVALVAAAIFTYLLRKFFPEITIETISSRFSSEVNGTMVHGIPQSLPVIHFPWFGHGLDQPPTLVMNLQMIRALLPASLTIALLGSIESLLSAVVADGMARTKHDSDTELVALGIGNIFCPFFGGIPATGAIARTATNIRSGAQSPLSAVIHGLFVLLVVLCLAPWVSQLPMAALAGLLMIVAYRMAEVRNFFHIVKVAPKSDVFVLLTCFFLTVFFDMVIGVGVGVVLAALLFMRRMAEFTSGKMLELHELHEYQTAKVVSEMPREVLFYQIAGPLFFGATQRAIEALSTISDQVKVVVFDLRLVPVMDVSGLIALETTIAELKTTGRFAIFTGVTKPVKELISKSPHINQAANVAIFDVIEEAVTMAKKIVKNSV